MRRIGIMSLLLITMCVGSKAQRLHLFSDSIRNLLTLPVSRCWLTVFMQQVHNTWKWKALTTQGIS